VGIEREWSGHASGPGARFAGARTFLLLGILGGIAGILLVEGVVAIPAVLLASASALTVTAYAVAARREGAEAVDGTTEAAALVVLALAVLAGLDHLRLAAAVGAVLVLALREKSAIQAFVHRIGEVELRAALQFAVLALVLLPILPVGPYGPMGGVRPRDLWFVVLLVSGLNFAGYLARRLVGESRGTAVAGLIGGLISSTAVALTFSRQSRESGVSAGSLALGVVGACTVLVPRVAVLTLALQPSLTPLLLPYLGPPLVLGILALMRGLHRGSDEGRHQPPQPRSPLRLGSAMLLALGFQAVLMLVAVVRGWLGQAGVVGSAALLGLTDLDALTYSMSRLAGAAELLPLAGLAIAVGVLANTLVKLGIVVVVGRGEFRRQAGFWLAGLVLASVAGLWLGR
jgi:uncharacterized membrane protein (DUF4010 family)